MRAYRNVLLGFLGGAALGVAPALAMTPCNLADLTQASWEVTAVSVNGVAFERNGTDFTSDAGAVVHVGVVRTWADPTFELEAAATVAPNCSVQAPLLHLDLKDPDTGESLTTSVEPTP